MAPRSLVNLFQMGDLITLKESHRRLFEPDNPLVLILGCLDNRYLILCDCKLDYIYHDFAEKCYEKINE